MQFRYRAADSQCILIPSALHFTNIEIEEKLNASSDPCLLYVKYISRIKARSEKRSSCTWISRCDNKGHTYIFDTTTEAFRRRERKRRHDCSLSAESKTIFRQRKTKSIRKWNSVQMPSIFASVDRNVRRFERKYQRIEYNFTSDINE